MRMRSFISIVSCFKTRQITPTQTFLRVKISINMKQKMNYELSFD